MNGTRTDHAMLLDHMAAIAPLPPVAAAAFADRFRPMLLPKGMHFAELGRVERNIGFLVEGVVRAYHLDPAGNAYNKTLFTPGRFIGGYSSLITGRPNRIAQQALTPCRVLVAPYTTVTALFDAHPAIERLARRLAELYFVEKEEREVALVQQDAAARYATLLSAHPELPSLIPQHHIASHLGITPTQLSRIRRKHRPM